MKELSKSTLESYVISNSEYYENYLDEFNQRSSQGKMLVSWNGAMFFFPFAWLIYRKFWAGLVLIVPLIWIFITLLWAKIGNYYTPVPWTSEMISPHSNFAWVMLAPCITVILTMTLLANNGVLSLAKKSEGTGKTARTSLPVTWIASLCLYAPVFYIALQLSLEIFYKRSIEASDSLESSYLSHEPDRPTPYGSYDQQQIEKISKSYLGLNKISFGDRFKIDESFVCFDSVDLIKKFEEKGLKISEQHLNKANECHAEESMEYLIKRLQQ